MKIGKQRIGQICLALAGGILALLIIALLIEPDGFVQGASASPAIAEPIRTQYQEPAPAVSLLKGSLAPRQWVNAGFTRGGRVDRLLVKEGDRVKAGDPLAQLGNVSQNEAEIASAELELTLAQQALQELYDHADYDLALAEQSLAEAEKEVNDADWHARTVEKPVPALYVEQAYANMQLAEKGLEKRRDDLRKANKLWKDKENIIWKFVKRHNFKLLMLNMQRKIALAETRYQKAVNTYNHRLKEADAIDVTLAQADLAVAKAKVQKARQDRDRLLSGPDPDQVAKLQARIRAAQSRLDAAQANLAATRLVSPISGRVISVEIKEGEWTGPGQTVVVLADLTEWVVEASELTEAEITALQPGETVKVTFDALPQVLISGTVESLDRTYQVVHGDVRFHARVGLKSASPDLRWGMTARFHPVN